MKSRVTSDMISPKEVGAVIVTINDLGGERFLSSGSFLDYSYLDACCFTLIKFYFYFKCLFSDEFELFNI